MAVLDHAVDEAATNCNLQLGGINELRRKISIEFWRWFRENRRDVVLKRKILFFSVTLRVEDLQLLFEQLFGEDPLAPLLVDFSG